MKDVFVLRPHHGMCLQFFEGKGYSSSFTKNMAYILDHLEREDPDICLVVGPDRICSACPHQKDGLCDAEEKTENYDRSVLAATVSGIPSVPVPA